MIRTRENVITVAWRFALVVVPTVLVLGVLNALPQFLGGEPLGVIRYNAVEDLEARQRTALWRPSGLPAPWAWPPSRIRLAVGEPGWVEFLFKPAGHQGEALVVCQTVGSAGPGTATPLQRWGPGLRTHAASEGDVPAVLLPAGELLQASDILFDGRVVRMRRLLLDDGVIVHELWWREATTRVMLRLRGSADRVPQIARRMFGNRP
jgi:hypothetical protein